MKDTDSIKAGLETDEIADTLSDYLQFEGAKILKESETGTRHKLTRKVEQRLNRIIRDELRKQHRHYRFYKKAVWVAAILLSLFLAVYASAIHATISNYFLERKNESLDFSGIPNPDQHTWSIGVSMPTEIPSGYQLKRAASYQTIIEFTYENKDEHALRLTVYMDNTSIRIDSEDADEVTEISVSGLPGYAVVKKGEMQIFWGKSPACLLEGPSNEKAALIRMAESMVYLPD